MFILASASPRRKDLLAQINVVPDSIIPADIDETPRKDEQPRSYVMRVAREKAHAIAGQHPDAIILAADTVVAMGRRILPKAEDEATARDCLAKLSGRRHRVMTAFAMHRPNHPLIHKCVTTTVKFNRLSQADIDSYIQSGEWDGKAGGYAIQGIAQSFIPFINGSYSNVVGLPLAEIAIALTQIPLTCLQATPASPSSPQAEDSIV